MLVHCMVRKEILRPDWNARRLEMSSNARMRAAGSLSGSPKMRAINRAVIWTPGRQRPAYKI
jgi:hypothetical protein